MWASAPQYVDHLTDLWSALPAGTRGAFRARPGDAAHRAEALGVVDLEPSPGPIAAEHVIVAAYSDLRSVVAARCGRVCLVEHGAGQTYLPGVSAGYPGGDGRDDVSLFLAPNPRVLALNRAAYPDAAHALVGAPRLDALKRLRSSTPRTEGWLAVLSWHWPCVAVHAPESGTAWLEYRDHLTWIAEQFGGTIALHAHPRYASVVATFARKVGLEWIGDFRDVVKRADVYAVDNSSTLYEAAAVGVPVVVVNSQWWRRDIEHGLRFWSHAAVGLQVDAPEQFPDALESTLRADPMRSERERLAADVFPIIEGAAPLAAAAVAQWASCLPS